MIVSHTVTADKEGRFQFADLPPGRYELDPAFGAGTPFSADPIAQIEVGPNAVARVRIPLLRHVDAQRTGPRRPDRPGDRGDRPPLRDDRLAEHLRSVDQAGDRRRRPYTIGARPGRIQVQLSRRAEDLSRPSVAASAPSWRSAADRTWPDLKLAPRRRARRRRRRCGRPAGRRGARSIVLPIADGVRLGRSPAPTGPDGTFHLDQLDPDDTLPLWARTKEATTDGTVVVRPRDVKGKLTLTIDPKYAFRIRGLVTDRSRQADRGGQGPSGGLAHYVSEKLDGPGMGDRQRVRNVHDRDGGLVRLPRTSGRATGTRSWSRPRATARPRRPRSTGKAGETHDLGTIVLTGTDGHLAGRVVGSDGRPIAGATVFNRGDGPGPVDRPDRRLRAGSGSTACSRGRSTPLSARRIPLHRRQGDGDADDLTITLLKTGEPPPAWKPGSGRELEDQRASPGTGLDPHLGEVRRARRAERRRFACIRHMARIDPDLALQWSAEHGHRVRQPGPRRRRPTSWPRPTPRGHSSCWAWPTAETEPVRPPAARRTVRRGRPREGPPVRRGGGGAVAGALDSPTGPRAGRGRRGARPPGPRRGRAQADRRGRAPMPPAWATTVMEGYSRGVVAQALAPFDVDRALALIEPFEDPLRRAATLRFVAAAIAATDPPGAVALVDAMGSAVGPCRDRSGPRSPFGSAPTTPTGGPDHRGDEATARTTICEAEAFGWLAVAVAPRNRARPSPDRPGPGAAGRSAGGVRELDQLRRRRRRRRLTSPPARRHAGYPDMGSVIMRVMATRASPAGGRR